MTEEQFNNYKFSINTQVMFRGEWSEITEVWFRERKIGHKKSGILIDYYEVEDIKEG